MTIIEEMIQNYNENKLSLEDLQEGLWELSENALKSIFETTLNYYLSLSEKLSIPNK
ncbi:hypothetical protein [Carnobacterium mobile]|uniref:hypothetical protein n=1 Tax=Carnobacterium mobile TaxID=2750 RepID=UPI000AFC15D1|nr:hypothetical protein [Carnobacterium mobile]